MTLTTLTRRGALLLAAALLAACASKPVDTQPPPIVFVHGNGDNASLWMTTFWRFESNGWPRERLHAVDMPTRWRAMPTTRRSPAARPPTRR